MYKEVILLSSCDHPNIIRFYEIFECDTKLHFQLELCTGENLGDLLKKEFFFNEFRLKVIFRQVLLAINHMHMRGICHRDIKPENFMFKNPKDDNTLKLLDFGFAKRFFGRNGKSRLYKLVGTPAFVAPEVLSGDYDEKCDIWSAGILLYQMACGNFPYSFGDDLEGLYKQIMTGDIDYHKNFENLHLSDEFYTLLRSLLIANDKGRISVVQALCHPWFNGSIPQSLETYQKKNYIKNFFEFKNFTFFQKNVIRVYVKFLCEYETKDLEYLFFELDRDLDGVISFPELKYFLIQQQLFTSNQNCIQNILTIHQNDDYSIFYTEFLAATIEKSIILNDINLKKIFDLLNLDKDDYLSFKSIANIYNLDGYTFRRAEFDELLKRNHINLKSKNGLDFEEFKILMTHDLKTITTNDKEISKLLSNEICSKFCKATCDPSEQTMTIINT
jgi:calcium-dependent protein kinase